MSLDTVLQIGKVLRSNSEDNLKYFKYVASCPKDRDGNWPLCITIPVNPDFTFNWERVKITPENERNKLYYLKYTTSDNDSSPKKYLFGDICYTRKSEVDKTGKIKGVKDFGNFTFEKGQGNAFLNGLKAFKEIKDDYFINAISSLAEEIKEEKDRINFIKSVLNGYNNDKPVEVPNKREALLHKIVLALKILKECEEKNELFQFHTAFEKDLDKFNLVLLFAPAIEFILLNEKEKLDTYLTGENAIKEKYINVVLDKNTTVIKRFFTKDETAESFSSETRNKILQFADFSAFIHFEFHRDDKILSWQQFDESFKLIKEKLNFEITETLLEEQEISQLQLKNQGTQTNKYLVPSKSIYRTLCSGDAKNDIQFPNFDLERRFKSFYFKNPQEFENFLYTDSFVKNPIRQLYGTDIDFYIFPIIESDKEEEIITSKDYIDFFFSLKDETKLAPEPLCPSFENEDSKKLKRFDLVFADSSGNTTKDLIEISGLDKSFYFILRKEIESIEIEAGNLIRSKVHDKLPNPTIERALALLLGSIQDAKSGKLEFIEIKPNANYKSHLLKILPKIYLNNYYSDDSLLTSLIKSVEDLVRRKAESPIKIVIRIDKSTRKEQTVFVGGGKFEFTQISKKYELFKLNYCFLLKIQKSQTDKFNIMIESASYQIGLKLGKLAKPLKKKINSFEKRYVGLLTRHVSTKEDCVKFANDIHEMLTRHGKTWANMSAEVCGQIANLPLPDYDKENLAFGFFEGYFKYEVTDKRKDFFIRLEKLLADFEGNPELQEETERLNDVLNEINK